MKKHLFFRKALVITGFLLTLMIQSFGQQVPGSLTVDTAMPVTQMVQNLVGPGVQISNVVVTGAAGSYGYYNINGTEIGTSEGILLSTGKAINAIGPNDETGLPQLGPPPTFTCLNCSNYNNNAPGSALLNAAQSRTTFDACQIEFDIIPSGDSLRFKYTFASEEYNEWVGSPFNDVFGFFISGPNIGTDVNIALIPNTSTVVAINTVNANTNSQYWVNNITPPGQGFQFDGFTVNLAAAVGNLIPCESYHLKLVIADGSDRIYDSNVLVSQIESNPVVVAAATAGGLDFMIEGCNDGIITFSRQEAASTPQTVTYYIGGTALNGVDYTQLGNGVPGEPITTVIPANETSVSIDVQAFADAVGEDPEYITIYLSNPLCTGPEFLDSLNFFIEDFLVVDVQPEIANICAGQCVELTGIASVTGSSTFTWSPFDNLTEAHTLTPTACPTETTTYTLTSQVANCISSDEVTINVSYISLGLNAEPINCSNGNTGSIDLTVINANAPYQYEWTGPNGFISDVEDPQNLEDGEYCVTVTDASGCVASGCVTVVEFNVLAITDVDILLNGCFPISCFGACDGAVNTTVTGGSGALSFAWVDSNNNTVATTQNVTGLCAGTYTIIVTDELGCEVSNTVVIEEPQELFVNLIGQVDILCDGTSTGSITVDASGGCSPYFYVWAGFPANQTPVLSDIPSGNYQVSVTDDNGCASGNTLDIIVNDPIDPLEVTLDEVSLYPGGYNTSCPGSTDGYINVTASLGTAPYTFEWVNQASGQVVANTEDVADLACGTYVFTATDANGCEVSIIVDLTCVPQIQVSFETVPNPCGDEEAGLGEINILSTSGGHGAPFTYSYTGPSCAPCTAEDLTGLNSGPYVLTVTDALGCSRNFNINVGTETTFTVTGVPSNPTCGDVCNGGVNITVTPNGAYTTTWRDENGSVISNSLDLSGVCGGTYELEITDGSCTGFYVYTLTQPDPIEISVVDVINPICFGLNNGSIDIDVTGGVGPYTYSWTAQNCVFFGASSQDINNLFECCYTVVVTDATGCTMTEEICLDAPQVMDLFVSTSSDASGQFNISCNGGSDGSISVTTSGGTPDCVAYAPECYFYDWSVDVAQYGNDPNASFVSNLPAGTYAVNVTDINGCLATTTINLTEPDPITSNAVITDVSCNGNTDGQITPNLVGGTNAYNVYVWSPSVAPNANNATTLVDLDPGCYTLNVTDSNGCEATFEYCVEEPEILEADVFVTNPTPCTGVCDGSISVSPFGGTAPFTVTISGNGDTFITDFATDLCDGTYDISVVDVNGCTFNTTVTLESSDPITATIEVLQINPSQTFTLNCFGDCDGVLEVTPAGGVEPYTFVWTDASNNILGNNAIVQDLCAGNYCVEVTDANGCTVIECFDVTQPAEPLVITSQISVYLGGYNISCFNACDGSIDLTVSGGVAGYTFLWNDGDILDPNEDQTDLCAAFYNVLVTDENGCESLLDFTLTEPSPIVVNETISQFDGSFNVSCNGACDGTITLEILGGEGPYTAEWPSLGIVNSPSVTDLCAGTYDVIITDALGCTFEATYTITEPAVLAVSFSTSFDCTTGLTNICANITGGSGSYTYEWGNGATSNCIDVDTNGEYCVTITDSNGCIITECTDVSSPSQIEATSVVEATTCGACNGAITISVTGGNGNYTIDWTGAGTVDGQIQQLNLCAGPYSVTISDDNGCSTTIQFNVPGSVAPVAAPEIFNISCFGENNGGISAIFVDATGNVTVSWSFGGNVISTDLAITDLEPGTYTLTWTDEAGCGGVETYNIIEPAQLVLTADVSLYEGGFNVSTNEGNDGAIDITVEGGTLQYTYDWTHITTQPEPEDVGNLTAGTYSVSVIDANGCEVDSTFTLTQPSELKWPTGLTPNGDGFNDAYVIQGLEKYQKNEFKVFNRWGNVVYEKNNYNQDWKGQNSDGDQLPDGTYFVIFTSGNVSFNTYVDLRR
ncbi:MAG: choice-of-anchor L domain-containing protein [Flavobacteriales bacterium]